MPFNTNEPQTISLETFDEIIKDDNPLDGVRRLMGIGDVVKSYPVLRDGIQKIIKDKYGEDRHRYYPYIASVLAGKEKWNADAFYMGVKQPYKEQFKKWKIEFKNHIIDNEQLHEFWLL